MVTLMQKHVNVEGAVFEFAMVKRTDGFPDDYCATGKRAFGIKMAGRINDLVLKKHVFMTQQDQGRWPSQFDGAVRHARLVLVVSFSHQSFTDDLVLPASDFLIVAMALYRVDLQRIARIRVREARALLRARLYAGSYHVAGFAVECALKACIARNVARYEFPNKKIAEKSWTHVATELVKIAGLEASLVAAKTNPAFDVNWTIVTNWSPERRYEVSVSRTDAQGLYQAITARTHGVLRWIRQHW